MRKVEMLLKSLVLLITITCIFGQKSTSVYRIIPKTKQQLHELRSLSKHIKGVSFWKDPLNINEAVDVMIPFKKFQNFNDLMRKNDLKYNVHISDVQELLNNASDHHTIPRSSKARQWYQKFGWTKFHTLDEIYQWLDSLVQTYPNRVRTIIAGQSYERRAIKGVHLKFSPENKPGIFIEAGIHAREWISHTTATYLINQLLNNNDPAIRWLAESFEWYIFPCVNPDGYVYTHINPRNPKYRLWRKTRAPTGHQQCWGFSQCYPCYGADPNRNWDSYWGGAGSGHDGCEEIYAGKYAFSEDETKSLARYVSSISNKLFAYISFHSYIEKLMFPYGHTKAHLDNYDEQYYAGREAVNALYRRHGYQFGLGNIAETLGGPASGGSIDWVKSALKIPFVYVYELRGHANGRTYGFVPPPSEIIPSGEEVVDSLVALLKAATQLNYQGWRNNK